VIKWWIGTDVEGNFCDIFFEVRQDSAAMWTSHLSHSSFLDEKCWCT
jgi:hypothetical protein